MADVVSGTFKEKSVYFQKPGTTLPPKRTALGEINGNGYQAKNICLKLYERRQYQRSFEEKKRICVKQNFQIYEDEETLNDENILPSSKSDILKSLPKEYQTFSLDTSEGSPLLHAELINKKKISTDSIWDTPYRKDIYSYFRSVEEKFQPNANYMDKQSDITMNMRSVLVDWLVEVGEEYKINVETLYLAVSYIDRFLSQMSVLRGKLQLVGTASMFLAAKYEEIYPPELKDFVYITDDTYSKKQILRMEHLILKVLNFDVSVPTAYSFLQLYCSMGNAPETVIHLSQYICELSLLDGDPFLKFRSSIVAAGSLALANYTLGHHMWGEVLVEATGYQLSELVHVVSCLFNKYSSISMSPQQAISEKYKSSRFDCVSTIQVPKEMIFSG